KRLTRPRKMMKRVAARLSPFNRDSLRNRGTVVPGVAGTVVDAACHTHDRLSPAELAAAGTDHTELVAHCRQRVAYGLGHRSFDHEIAALEVAFGEAARFERLLDRHAEVRDVGDELCVGLRLIP